MKNRKGPARKLAGYIDRVLAAAGIAVMEAFNDGRRYEMGRLNAFREQGKKVARQLDRKYGTKIQ